MTTQSSIARIRALVNEKLSMRSDDFGHDCHALLVAESNALQEVGVELSRLVDALEVAERALEFYSGEGGIAKRNIEWNPHVCDSYSGRQYAPDWLGEMQDEPGEIAQKARAEIARMLEEK